MEKLKKYVQKACGLFELIMAVIVLLGIVIAIISMVKDVDLTQSLFQDTANFKEFLVNVFAIVIGIEFLEMLCRPNPDNVIQVLVFLIARHMIVGETSPYEDFVSVISVAILLLLSRYLHMGKKGERKDGEREA
ncbi:MAG: phosphate-starvation-inducible PsiE family protein [Lachnospiraceae bacterium]|nr:phosphate-starvation-inducible PsiE family protein [Lachnospiraceae bacterium]MDE6980201.1 phosphate-starvation-inducible PsiE family protein [Lachnospiraceae bacterium]